MNQVKVEIMTWIHQRVLILIAPLTLIMKTSNHSKNIKTLLKKLRAINKILRVCRTLMKNHPKMMIQTKIKVMRALQNLIKIGNQKIKK